MIIKLRFDYYSRTVFFPDGYIKNTENFQRQFLEWVTEKPDCIVKTPGGAAALSYDENDFLEFLNEILPNDSTVKAYFIKQEKRRADRTIEF